MCVHICIQTDRLTWWVHTHKHTNTQNTQTHTHTHIHTYTHTHVHMHLYLHLQYVVHIHLYAYAIYIKTFIPASPRTWSVTSSWFLRFRAFRFKGHMPRPIALHCQVYSGSVSQSQQLRAVCIWIASIQSIANTLKTLVSLGHNDESTFLFCWHHCKRISSSIRMLAASASTAHMLSCLVVLFPVCKL